MEAGTYKKLMLIAGMFWMGGFAFAQKIVSYQYWFDNQTAEVQTASVSALGPAAIINGSVNTSALSKGYHLVTFRFEDNNNHFSTPVTYLFVIGNADITGYEYWIDFDYSAALSSSVTPAQQLDLNTVLDLSKLSDGTHYLLMHFKDANNTWSSVTIDTISVITGINPVSALNSLKLNPTLTSGTVQLSGSLKTSGKLTIQIYNNLGVKVGEKELPSASQVNESFNLQSFSPGTYFMLIRQGEDYLIKKFVKQ
jgi:Secretion system C-terminal sorting domain